MGRVLNGVIDNRVFRFKIDPVLPVGNPALLEKTENRRSDIVRTLQISSGVRALFVLFIYIPIYGAWVPIQTFLYGKKYS